MRICYLLLCHKNEDQVCSLINQLSNSDCDFCVHVDKKIDRFKLPEKDNVFVVSDEKRIDVSWGGMSVVIATLVLIDLALEHGPYDYIALLSGQDYPIKSNEYINSYLEANYGSNFIDVNTQDDIGYRKMKKRVDLYYPAFMRKRTILSRVLKKLYVLCCPIRRKVPLAFSYGSQWWILTQNCVAWIREYIDKHPDLIDFFKNSLVPDESFFQMLFLESPYSKTQHEFQTYLEWDYSGNHPRVLKEIDVPMLLKRHELFARKFDITIDAKSIDCLSEFI